MIDEIERQIELCSSPQEVWRALTDPAWLATWLAEDVELELRPGGEARFTVDGEHRDGWVEEVVAPRGGAGEAISRGRLAFWWTRRDEPATRVRISVVGRLDGGTTVRVVESRPLEILDLVGVPLPGQGGPRFGPALTAAAGVLGMRR